MAHNPRIFGFRQNGLNLPLFLTGTFQKEGLNFMVRFYGVISLYLYFKVEYFIEILPSDYSVIDEGVQLEMKCEEPGHELPTELSIFAPHITGNR